MTSLALAVAVVICPATEVAHYRLRNVAAADLAVALTAFAQRQTMQAVLAVEPTTNSLFVSARPADLRRLGQVVADTDRPVPTVLIGAVFVRAPAGFMKKTGFDGPTTLTDREAKLLAASHKLPGHAILSETTVIASINKSICLNDGLERPAALLPMDRAGMALQVTPHLSPDGRTLLLRTEVQFTAAAGGDVKTLTTILAAPDGGSVVVPGWRSGETEVLLVMTVNKIRR